MNFEDLNVAHHTASVNGIHLHYVAKGRGPLVILLHGFPEMWWSWRYQIDFLAAQGLRVVAPDLRGYNDSEVAGPYDLDTLTLDVRDLVHALGAERADIVGHDWGAVIGWQLAMTHPGVVDRLVIINGPHPTAMLKALATSRRQRKKSRYILFNQLPLIPEWLWRKNDGALLARLFKAHAIDHTNFSHDDLEPLRENILRPGRIAAMLAYYRGIRRTSPRQLWRTLLTPPPVEAETLVIWGTADGALEYDALVPGLERYCPRLKVEPIDDAGHFVHAERPERVNPLLASFLARPAVAPSTAAATRAPKPAPRASLRV